MLQRPWIKSLVAFLVIFGAVAIFLYWFYARDRVFIDNSYIDAPIVNIAATAGGTLNSVAVQEGDTVAPNSPVAVVGSEVLYAKDGGIVTAAPKALGSYYPQGMTVVSVVVTSKMRVVGTIDENKGLNEIAPGERATFSVDAFPGKTYNGVVREISPVSNDTGVVFSISDKRPTKKFDVYIDFDIAAYPELKSGMSAKVTVLTK